MQPPAEMHKNSRSHNMKVIALIAVAAISACKTSPPTSMSKDTLDAIGICNGGLSINTNHRLDVNLAKVAEGSVGAELKVRNEIVGKIAQSLQVSEEQAVAFYREYVACVQSRQSVKELLVILRGRAKVVEKNLSDDGYTDLVARFQELYPTYFTQLESGQAVAAYETYRSIQATLTSAAARKSNGGDWSDMMQFRYNMSQHGPGGRRMSAEEFDAWLKSRGFEKSIGTPLQIGNLPAVPANEYLRDEQKACPQDKDACV